MSSCTNAPSGLVLGTVHTQHWANRIPARFRDYGFFEFDRAILVINFLFVSFLVELGLASFNVTLNAADHHVFIALTGSTVGTLAIVQGIPSALLLVLNLFYFSVE